MRLFAWFRSHPLTTIFLAVVGFALGMHFFANWRAEVRWQRYCAEARARGVKLTLAEFAPPEIPDAENFAALPMFRAIFSGGVQRPMELPVAPGGKPPAFGDAVKGERIDWKAWQKYCADLKWISETTEEPASDVLRGLEHYAPQFAEWREWRTRPRCRFPLELAKGIALPLPHLGTFQDAARLFSLRMRAHLALGDSAAAYADFEDGFQAYRALQEEPTLISGLVQIAAVALLRNAIGEGLGNHAWAEPELRKLEADMAKTRVWEDYKRGFESERGFGNWLGDSLADSSPAKRTALFAGMGPPTAGISGAAFMLIPKRIYRDNQLRQNHYMDEVLARASEDGKSFDPDSPVPSGPENLTGIFDIYYFFLFRMSAPVFSTVGERFVHLKTQLDEARVACALERFRLARGAFPETLAELAPEFMAEVPVDTYSRQPLIYRRGEGGTFQLYGVGNDRKDDGGAVDAKRSENKQRDDIWLYAPPPAP